MLLEVIAIQIMFCLCRTLRVEHCKMQKNSYMMAIDRKCTKCTLSMLFAEVRVLPALATSKSHELLLLLVVAVVCWLPGPVVGPAILGVARCQEDHWWCALPDSSSCLRVQHRRRGASWERRLLPQEGEWWSSVKPRVTLQQSAWGIMMVRFVQGRC